MAPGSVVSFPAAAACCCVVLLAAVAASASAAPQVFVVGGEPRRWRKPAPHEETYNHWAARNRFHVGDFLHFKYDRNDSVLVVSRDDYKLCGAGKPSQRFDSGDTRFRLDRSGFFYFLSGAPGHCGAGQRMAARVLAAQQGGGGAVAPALAAARRARPPATAMSPGGGDDGSYSGEFKPRPRSGSPGSMSLGKPPPPQGSTSGAASVTAPSLVAGYHVVVFGAVLGFVFMCLAS